MKNDTQYLEAVRAKRITPLEIQTAQLYDTSRKEQREQAGKKLFWRSVGKRIDLFLRRFNSYTH